MSTDVGADVSLIRQHLLEILHSSAFKGSGRSQDFLKYIVEKALEGSPEALKERTIGIELFGRSPAYATAEDAIVRVTASAVRRRLLQHYGGYGAATGMRIELPAGSYVPEFRSPAGRNALETYAAPKLRSARRVLLPLALLAVLCGLGLGLWKTRSNGSPAKTVLPWPVFFGGPDQTQTTIVTSDTDLVTVQDLTGFNIPLADYANRKYLPNPDSLDAATRQLCLRLRGDHCASIDTGIVLSISDLARAYSQNIRARSARSLTLGDLESDDNFIFLGSPRSNPWSELFEDQLDFSFAYDGTLKKEVIRNKHPQPGELPLYVPTARGWETGRAFAIAAFVNNPGQEGQVLLLAGSNAEGTQSAAEFVADLPLLSDTLQRHGIQPAGPVQHFEALLRLRTMAGSPRSFEVLAFHRLPEHRPR